MSPSVDITDLLAYSRDITSEHGEDGIIKRIFEIIGTESRSCVELGALNGVHGSNVWHLVKNEGWSGVLIEADRTYFERLQKEFAGMLAAECVNAFVSFEGPNSLDSIFAKTSLPKTFDLFSLDIDGIEYHLWDSLQDYRPRLMVVEFNPTIPNEVAFVQPRDMNVYQGSSLRSFVELGKRKGYELVAANEVNAFFVLKELYSAFDIADNSIDTLHTDHRYETKLYQLYDGTLRIAGYDRLMWHNRLIDSEEFQVLPKRKRVYPAMISPNPLVRAMKYIARKMPFYRFVQKIRKMCT